MPPVREASTKPSAATVLPAPVACSNQKRLAALGSSGCSSSCSSSSSSASVLPVLRLLGLVVVVVVLLARDADGRQRDDVSASAPCRRCRGRCRCAGPRRAARSACPRARRPGGRRGPCRRPASAPPRRAAARGRAAATTRAATRPTGLGAGLELGRARRRAHAGAALPGASAVAASSPSSTKGSRVNFAARSRSAEVVGVVADRPLTWFRPRKARRSGRDGQRGEVRDRWETPRGLDVEPGAAAAAPLRRCRPRVPPLKQPCRRRVAGMRPWRR